MGSIILQAEVLAQFSFSPVLPHLTELGKFIYKK